MAGGYRSSSDRDAGLRSGKAHGVSVNNAQIGRADSSHVAPHVGKGGLNRRADQGLNSANLGGPLPKPRPAVGQPVRPPGPEVR
jgi:hypothetical protein